ncbi:hypothetical protein [Leifsonia xyli]|uniref:hypothetical protein n=1 Tax=Leifsonia xyli TaxID=1575 RepID=UPI0002DC3E9F|nr:hypothetical protein [Leifsonia xyli]
MSKRSERAPTVHVADGLGVNITHVIRDPALAYFDLGASRSAHTEESPPLTSSPLPLC